MNNASNAMSGSDTQASSSSGASGNDGAGVRSDVRGLVAPAKGFSQLDWLKVMQSGRDLTGLGGPARRRFSRSDVRKHR